MADYLGNNAAEYFVAYMLGRSLVGMRTEDLLVSARYLASRTGKGKVRLIAMGDVIEPAGHAVAQELVGPGDAPARDHPLDRYVGEVHPLEMPGEHQPGLDRGFPGQGN